MLLMDTLGLSVAASAVLRDELQNHVHVSPLMEGPVGLEEARIPRACRHEGKVAAQGTLRLCRSPLAKGYMHYQLTLGRMTGNVLFACSILR